MRVTDTRKHNLLLLRRQYESDAALARATKTPPSYIWQVLRDPEERRKLGEDFARKVERELGLEDGWMDTEHEPHNSGESTAERESALHEIALAVESGLLDADDLLALSEIVRRLARKSPR